MVELVCFYWKNYDHLFKINTKTSGGSFYLQSKVFRARERLEMELYTDLAPPTSQDNDDTKNSDSSNPS